MPNVHKITTRTNLHKPILKLTHTNIITCARANTASEKVFHNGCIGIDHQTKRDITITSNKFFRHIIIKSISRDKPQQSHDL